MHIRSRLLAGAVATSAVVGALGVSAAGATEGPKAPRLAASCLTGFGFEYQEGDSYMPISYAIQAYLWIVDAPTGTRPHDTDVVITTLYRKEGDERVLLGTVRNDSDPEDEDGIYGNIWFGPWQEVPEGFDPLPVIPDLPFDGAPTEAVVRTFRFLDADGRLVPTGQSVTVPCTSAYTS